MQSDTSDEESGGGGVAVYDMRRRAQAEKQSMLIEEEQEKLSHVRNSLQKSQALADDMVGILSSFETRLTELANVMAPIHETTTTYTRAHENIGQTVAAIGEIMANLSIAGEVEDRIMLGPRGDYDTFLSHLDKIYVALEFLVTEGQHFKSAQKKVQHLKALAQKALPEIEMEFTKLASRHHNTIDLDMLREGGGGGGGSGGPGATDTGAANAAAAPVDASGAVTASKTGGGVPKVELYPSNVVHTMRAFVKRLRNFEQRGYLKSYRDARSRLLLATVEKLLPEKESEGSSKQQPGTRYEKGGHRFVKAMRGFLALMQAERKMCRELLDSEHVDGIFGDIVEEPVNLFVSVGESIAKNKKAADRVFVMLDLLEYLNEILEALTEATATADGRHGEGLNKLIWSITMSSKKAMKDVDEGIKMHPPAKITTDGTVHELTSTTLGFLRRLLEYKDTVESLLPTPSGVVNDEEHSALGVYMVHILSDLEAALESKSKSYKSMSLSYLFLANNYQHIITTVRSSELLAYTGSQFIHRYQSLVDTNCEEYQRATWIKPLKFLLEEHQKDEAKMENARHGKKSDGGLTKSQRHAVKDRWIGFNTLFSSIYHAHRNYAVPNSELRTRIRAASVKLVAPAYTQFYNAFETINFSKNKGKYVKYPTNTLTVMIEKFFEGPSG